MKLRKHKKRLYANVKNNRSFAYHVEQIAAGIAAAMQKMSMALRDAYRGQK